MEKDVDTEVKKPLLVEGQSSLDEMPESYVNDLFKSMDVEIGGKRCTTLEEIKNGKTKNYSRQIFDDNLEKNVNLEERLKKKENHTVFVKK